jgi:polar amino acid transport system substrate-binding protein
MKSGCSHSILALLLSLSATAFSKDVKIAFGLTKPPYVVEQTKSGLEFDIIAEALKAAGHQMKPVFAPQSRGELILKSKDVDGAATKRLGSLEGHYPSDAYIDYYNYAAGLKSKPLQIQKISDLGKYSVLAFQTAKTLLGTDFKAMAEANPNYAEVADQQLQIAQLLRKRVDVVVGDILIFKYFQRKLKEDEGLTDEIVLYDIFPTNSYVVMFNDEKLRDSFNKGLAKIRSNKTYTKLIDKYSNKKP